MKEHSIAYKGINPDELIKIADCGLSARATNALVKANFEFLQDITVNTQERIRQIPVTVRVLKRIGQRT